MRHICLTGIAFCVLGLATGLSGCGQPASGEPAPFNPAELRSLLQVVADTGEGGSGLDPIGPAIESIRKTKPELADKLSKDAQELGRVPGVPQRKEIAKRMLAALDAEVKPAGGAP